MSDIRVVKQDYHRNGIGGAGFIVSLVEWPAAQRDYALPTPHFLAVTFPGEDRDNARERFIEQTAVLSIDLIAGGVIEAYVAPGGNAWRGSDNLGPAVADAYQAQCRKEGYDPFDPDIGFCDAPGCSETYDLASRNGRCGDCGFCATHCEHPSEVEI